MNIGIRIFTHFDGEFVNKEGEPVREVIHDYPEAVRRFVTEKKKANEHITSINFYISVLIERPGEHPHEPHRRFGEVSLTPDEAMLVDANWIRDAANAANSEIDQFMKDGFAATPQRDE